VTLIVVNAAAPPPQRLTPNWNSLIIDRQQDPVPMSSGLVRSGGSGGKLTVGGRMLAVARDGNEEP
jgi:hypothetical protein